MKRILIFAARVIDKLINDKTSLYAGESTLFLLISSVPFIILLLNFAQYLIPFSQVELLELTGVFPEKFIPIIKSVINEVFTVPAVSVVSITTVATLWTASKGFTSLIRGLDVIFSGSDARGFIGQRIYSFFYTLLFVVTIVLTLVAVAMGNKIIQLAAIRLPHLNGTLSFIINIRSISLFLFLTLMFMAGYAFLPKKRIRFFAQLPGAMTASASWLVFSYAYGIYIENFSNYSNIYGSLAAIVLIVIWLYFCINIFMIGAAINVVISEKE